MSIAIPTEWFPSRAAYVKAEWAPLMFAPNPDTPERLVIGVAAVNERGFYVAPAESAKRLTCLYGAAAVTALLVQDSSISLLREDLAGRGRDALWHPHVPFSGVSVGSVREGEAQSLQELAEQWLRSISSVHEAPTAGRVEAEEAVESAVSAIRTQTDNDRLPVLVYREIEETAPPLGAYFSSEIRLRAKKGLRTKPQNVFIGFAGSRVVANFATLRPTTRPRPAIDHIKRLMWDLARHRDTEVGLISTQRSHEMIVFHRDENDPEIDEKRAEDIKEMLGDLREQGSKEDILVQPRSSVGSIADHIRIAEMTAAPRTATA
jgi:hypothetical protein